VGDVYQRRSGIPPVRFDRIVSVLLHPGRRQDAAEEQPLEVGELDDADGNPERVGYAAGVVVKDQRGTKR
jgi:hypothetical protein